MDRATENFHSLVELLVTGKSIHRAGLEKQDVLEEISRDDQTIIANGLCSQFPYIVNGVRGMVTWGPNDRFYCCESADESVARWAGYKAYSEEHENELNEVIWWGTRPTESGTFVAQFEIVGRE